LSLRGVREAFTIYEIRERQPAAAQREERRKELERSRRNLSSGSRLDRQFWDLSHPQTVGING
jgi:hypothetical protein